MLVFYLSGFKKLFSIGKKVILVLATFFIVISLFAYFINKDKPKVTYNPIEKNRQEIYKVINDPKLNSTKDGKFTIKMYKAMMCGTIGEACTDNPADGNKNFGKSLFGMMTNLIVLPYANPPASGVYWAYSGLQNAGFVPKTYAAEGIGFAAIKPYASIWKIFRDLSYLLLVLILISIGFMIMFRMKLNPQTVISVESALPKIVVSLLLITFSFAIAGFLIDLMYITMIFVITQLYPLQKGAFASTNLPTLINKFLGAGFMEIWPSNLSITPWDPYSIGNSLISILPDSIRSIMQLTLNIAGSLIFLKLAQNIGLNKLFEGFHNWNAATFGWGKAPAIVALVVDLVLLVINYAYGAGFIVGLLVVFTVALLLFRIFFMLLTTYIQTLLLIMFSPLLLLFEAIPGKGTFTYWFRNLFANIFTFVVVLVLILIAGVMMVLTETSDPWAPPFLYGMSPQAFSGILGIGIYLLIPDLVKAFKELLGAKGLPVSLGIGTFFGGVGAAWGGTQAGIGMFSSFSQMPFVGNWMMKQARDGTGPFGRFLKGAMPSSIGEQMVSAIQQAKKNNQW